MSIDSGQEIAIWRELDAMEQEIVDLRKYYIAAHRRLSVWLGMLMLAAVFLLGVVNRLEFTKVSDSSAFCRAAASGVAEKNTYHPPLHLTAVRVVNQATSEQ